MTQQVRVVRVNIINLRGNSCSSPFGGGWVGVKNTDFTLPVFRFAKLPLPEGGEKLKFMLLGSCG
jgi:hypothetical protein